MVKLKNYKYITSVKDIIDNVNGTIADNKKNIITDNKKNIITDNSNIKEIEKIDNEQKFITHKKNKNVFDNTDEITCLSYELFGCVKQKNDINTTKKNIIPNLTLDINSSSTVNSQTTLKYDSASFSSPNNNNIYKKIKDKNIFFNELLKKQLTGISSDKKLNYNDIKRISKFIKSSIFDKKKCSIWNGYITNENNNLKGTYINFYFNKKKIALHRLLYINYIGVLSDNEYLKFSCENKGKCCNINHMKKYTYNNANNNKTNLDKMQNNNDEEKNNKQTTNNLGDFIQINVDKKKLIVEI